MSLEVSTELGRIEVSSDVIATIAGAAAMDCYGLVGMASLSHLRDGITELLGQENLSRGIEVRTEDGELCVNMHVIVGYGTKISEVAHNIQSKVVYTLDQMVGVKAGQVNIYVQGVRPGHNEER
ncbi:Asp23/Gls24 family envelope stress response protein [Pasteuria penetrans]|uniref:Asp23/Gls24 family envelope stress response protein n=1 Tax=Pasteuria penetrans TaxID=86005 RepID=UPI000FAE5BEF|nr:Asp23/Gls24 family envelope stress response protein [Pasteuria penetrans]